MIDPLSLEALEAVVDEGSIAKAAERMNKSVSSVSYHLRRLEDTLKVELLDRSGYRLVLTRKGQDFLSEARMVLAQLRALGDVSTRFGEGWEPALKIVYDGSLPTHPILVALDEIGRKEVPTQIELIISHLGGVEFEFDKSNADIVVAAMLPPRHDLLSRPLAGLSFTLCCSPEHVLATMPEVTLPRLRQETELIVQGLVDDPKFNARSFQSRRVHRLGDFHTKLAAVRHGLGYGWLPDYVARPLLETGALAVVRYEGGSTSQQVPHFGSRVDKPLGKAGKIVLQVLEAQQWHEQPPPA